MNRRQFLTRAVQVSAVTALGSTLGACYGFAEATNVEVVRVEVGIRQLPASLAGFRIAFLTDIHHGRYVHEEFISSVVRTTRLLDPDLILLGGDYVLGSPKFIAPCFELLRHLRAPCGVFGVLGNHDHYEGQALTRAAMRRAGITELGNRGVRIRPGASTDSIWLAGIDDLWEGNADVVKALNGIEDQEPCLLLSHNPDVAETLHDRRVSLMISGHTHGGQISLPGLRNPFLPSQYGDKYRAGLVQAPETQVYISRGLGTTGLPVRYNCRPELTLLTLKSAHS